MLMSVNMLIKPLKILINGFKKLNTLFLDIFTKTEIMPSTPVIANVAK
jgi:hypothetical protein